MISARFVLEVVIFQAAQHRRVDRLVDCCSLSFVQVAVPLWNPSSGQQVLVYAAKERQVACRYAHSYLHRKTIAGLFGHGDE